MKGSEIINSWEYRKNSYRLIVSERFELNGKPMIHRKTIHGTKKDAEIELAKFVTEVQNVWGSNSC